MRFKQSFLTIFYETIWVKNGLFPLIRRLEPTFIIAYLMRPKATENRKKYKKIALMSIFTISKFSKKNEKVRSTLSIHQQESESSLYHPAHGRFSKPSFALSNQPAKNSLIQAGNKVQNAVYLKYPLVGIAEQKGRSAIL